MGTDMFEDKVIGQIRRYGMFEGAAHCVCGVSGGADSVSLLTVLARHRRELRLDIHVVHINHMIRGKDADDDQRYVESLCDSYGVECNSYRIDVCSIADSEGITVEEAGRNVRYDAFEKVRQRYASEGCVIAVAHNWNDVAETVMFNMARGTGMAGVKGIPARRGNIVRPLLGCDRSEIEAYLNRMGLKYCTDITNNEDEYTRNKIRHRILPVLCEVNPQAVEHICAMAQMAAEYEELASHMVRSFLMSQGIDADPGACVWHGKSEKRMRYVVDIDALRCQERLIQELTIRQLIGMAGGGLKDVGRSHVREVMKLYSSGTGAGIDLPGNGRARVEYGKLVFDSYGGTENDKDSQLADGGQSQHIDMINGGVYETVSGTVEVKIYERPDALDLSKKECTKYVDYDRISKCLQLRTYRKGDYIVVNSDGSRKKINRLFTDSKIPVDKRGQIPLIISGDEVVWAVGIRIGENYKITDSTRKILELDFRRKES